MAAVDGEVTGAGATSGPVAATAAHAGRTGGAVRPAAASLSGEAPGAGTAFATQAPHAKVRYADVIAGRAPVPSGGVGFFVFQTLMVLGMVTVMATFNGVRSEGLLFLLNAHWVYPVVFACALVWRRTVANAITSRLIPLLVLGRLHGFWAGLAKSAINVSTMNPAMCLLVKGPAGAVAFFLASEPLSLIAAIAVNVLLVGPAMKMLVNNRMDATDDVRVFLGADRALHPVMAFLGLS